MDSQPPDSTPAETQKKSFLDRFRRDPLQSANPDDNSLEVPAKRSLTKRLRNALSRTSEGIGAVFLGSKAIDDALLDELETLLLTADVGVEVTNNILTELVGRLKRNELKDITALRAALQEILLAKLRPCQQSIDIGVSETPFVILVIGVNGVGKTTTIGKLASRLQQQGKSVILAAGDTFRAAAAEQLQVWGERNNVPVVAQHTGADSASVIFDGIHAAKSRGIDVVIADTAGRLHN